jgi:hypothetical protein
VKVLRDAIKPVDLQPGDGDRAIDEMRAAGAEVVTSKSLILPIANFQLSIDTGTKLP